VAADGAGQPQVAQRLSACSRPLVH